MVFERVVDGDTFLASGVRIRVWGINAPEKKEPLFAESAKALGLYIQDSALSCKLIEHDRYQRQVMHCFINDTDLGSLMVKTGFAKDHRHLVFKKKTYME